MADALTGPALYSALAEQVYRRSNVEGLATEPGCHYHDPMTTADFRRGPSEPPRESDVERLARIAHKRESLAQARADMDAGLGVDWDDVETWLHELDSNDAPAPEPTTGPLLGR